MESWVYFFSQFTSEALFFQALAICVLVMAYTGYWILKKRRHGVAADEDAIPVSVVRTYLSELITDAHSLRAQLFGLLSDAGGPPVTARMPLISTDAGTPAPLALSSEALSNISSDPELKAKFSELERQLAAQSSALGSLTTEKARLEKELAAAKSAGGDSAKSDDGASGDLQSKIQELEEKLAEYSVIEDDLANLKRLQQENAQLKSALEAKGINPESASAGEDSGEDSGAESGSEPEAAAAPEEADAPAPATQEAQEQPEEKPAKKSVETAAAAAALAVASEPEPAAASEEPAVPDPQAGGEPEFDSLAAQAEEMLKSATPAAEPDAEPAAEAASADAPADGEDEGGAPVDNMGKSDEDLLSEFEKMLNS